MYFKLKYYIASNFIIQKKSVCSLLSILIKMIRAAAHPLISFLVLPLYVLTQIIPFDFYLFYKSITNNSRKSTFCAYTGLVTTYAELK